MVRKDVETWVKITIRPNDNRMAVKESISFFLSMAALILAINK